jgi:SAM-dependent methyltransferase
LLEDAARKARRLKLDINWAHGDMRKISFPKRFDAAINIFSSFGYFIDDGDDLKMLQSAGRSLKNGGKLIIDLENIFFVTEQLNLRS